MFSFYLIVGILYEWISATQTFHTPPTAKKIVVCYAFVFSYLYHLFGYHLPKQRSCEKLSFLSTRWDFYRQELLSLVLCAHSFKVWRICVFARKCIGISSQKSNFKVNLSIRDQTHVETTDPHPKIMLLIFESAFFSTKRRFPRRLSWINDKMFLENFADLIFVQTLTFRFTMEKMNAVEKSL